MTPSEVFHSDLRMGEILEVFIVEYIQENYPKANKIKGYFKPYDIIVPETNTTIEVKGDYKSNETNNILVEVRFNKKPSALLTTQATYWIFIDGYHIMWITPQQIKDCIKLHKVPMRTFTGRGDDKAKDAFLVPKPFIKDSCTLITEIEPDWLIHMDNIFHQL